MKKVSQISFYTGSREELLPGFTSKFPYISSCSDITKHPGHFCPWHWHPAMELFYLKQGSLEYNTPGSRILLAEGCGGLINSKTAEGAVVYNTAVAYPIGIIFAIVLLVIFLRAAKKHAAA